MRLAHLIFCLCIPFAFTSSQQDKLVPLAGGTDRPSRSTGSPNYTVLDINNFTSWSRSDAPGSLSLYGDAQAYFPAGTANVIYTDGIYWGAKSFTDANLTVPAPRQLIRVGGKGYRYGLQPGWVNGSGTGASRQSPSDGAVRIYRIRRDYASMSEQDLRVDAATFFESLGPSYVSYDQVQQIKDQYDKDWKEWPVQHGAPYIERNGIPGYQAPPAFSATFTVDSLIYGISGEGHYDEPGIAGADPNSPADQVIWTVANDLDPATTLAFEHSEPLGLEVQFAIWAYKSTGTLGNMLFKRIRLINKGGVDTSHSATTTKGTFWLDSVFVGLWSDPDVGYASDDLVGCDTTLQLAFSYNAASSDATFRSFSLPPPSVGYTLLQGPLVAGNPGDSGIVNFSKARGKKNLVSSSFVYEGAGDVYALPSTVDGWWKWLRGFASLPTNDIPYEHGPFPETKFPLSGDPVNRTGFIDGLGTTYSFVPGDKRIMLNSGSFTLAPGDTQEIVYAVVAGLGADWLSSVSAMKSGAKLAQRVQQKLFNPARGPLAPHAKVVELDRQIILEWGSDLQRVQQTEQGLIAGEYQFEGYNVYQLPSASAALKDGKKIATFDVKDGIKTIVDEEVDPQVGIIRHAVQTGTDAGVQRFINIKNDHLTDEFSLLNNGKEYFFAVTAYNYSPLPGASPKACESLPLILRAQPRNPFGIQPMLKLGDTLRALHMAGTGNGSVFPITINPLAGTGDSYEVHFDTSTGTTTWSLWNVTTNRMILGAQTNQTGDENYSTIEGGILLKVVNPKPGGTLNSTSDVFAYNVPATQTGPDVLKQSVARIGVFPNPYNAGRTQETTTWRHFVTFNNLPQKASISIFNLAGQLVRTLEKNDASQFIQWDLTNGDNWQVASGIYICYVEMPDIGETKILKLAVIQQQLMPSH